MVGLGLGLGLGWGWVWVGVWLGLGWGWVGVGSGLGWCWAEKQNSNPFPVGRSVGLSAGWSVLTNYNTLYGLPLGNPFRPSVAINVPSFQI